MKKKIDISTPLRVVSPELVANYERINLSGRTLKSVSEEYSTVKRDPDTSLIWWLRGMFLLFFVILVVCTLMSVMYFPRDPFLCYAVGVVPLVIYILIAKKKIEKDHEVRSRCGKILEDFEADVLILNIFAYVLTSISEKTIRANLVGSALGLLDAEVQFDIIRKSDNRDVDKILRAGNHLQACVKDFEQTHSCAKDKFGIAFNKSGLFAEAQQLIDNSVG